MKYLLLVTLMFSSLSSFAEFENECDSYVHPQAGAMGFEPREVQSVAAGATAKICVDFGVVPCRISGLKIGLMDPTRQSDTKG